MTQKMMARDQALAKKRMANFPPGSLVGDTYFRLYNISASIFRNHCLTLTMNAGIEPGTKFEVVLDRNPIGSVVVTEDRRLRGLLPLLRQSGATTGQTYAAKFDLVKKLIDLERVSTDSAMPRMATNASGSGAR